MHTEEKRSEQRKRSRGWATNRAGGHSHPSARPLQLKARKPSPESSTQQAKRNLQMEQRKDRAPQTTVPGSWAGSTWETSWGWGATEAEVTHL